jgi:catechol 2,3-dioxygenase-like lactoylglutathione lyase family enzyme
MRQCAVVTGWQQRNQAMDAMTAIEIKAYVPARDFDLSKQFYQDFGLDLVWTTEDLAYFRRGSSGFLLQNCSGIDRADYFMMHLLVHDVEAWWRHVQSQGVIAKYGVRAEPPEDRSWGIRDFVIIDPTGVLWRVGQNIPAAPP